MEADPESAAVWPLVEGWASLVDCCSRGGFSAWVDFEGVDDEEVGASWLAKGFAVVNCIPP